MSATRMLVLGVIHGSGQAHGYQVRTELMSWKAEEWARIKPGSIYHAIRKAAADGFLDVVPQERGDSGPERTAYRITESGVDEMRKLVREGLGRPRDPWMLAAALAMLPILTRDEAIAHVRERLVRLESTLTDLRTWRDEPDSRTPKHVLEQAMLWIGQVTSEIEWATGLLTRLSDGTYEMADDRRYSRLTGILDR
ncbi:MAG: PadR family transcriptional regulator [Actinomycetota bacterium]|nr:PadR family transcriptional regulator [Actinomycetota bacterium]